MINLVASCSNVPIIGDILSWLANILGYLMNWIYIFFESIGIANAGLCIIVFTFVVKAILLPLTFRQQKFSKISAIMNPEIQAIQKKYKNKKDAESVGRMQEETKLVYARYGTSPTGGCLQLVIQMPILFSLYYVIMDITKYVPSFRELTDVQMLKVNTFMGMNLSSSPWELITGDGRIIYAVLIPLIAGFAQFLSTRSMNMVTPSVNGEENPMATSMKTMTFTMPLVSTFFCFTMPAGVGLYWVASSVFQVISQLGVNKYFEKIDIKDIISKNVVKQKKKNEKKGISSKTVADASRYNTRNIPAPKDIEKNETTTTNTNTTETKKSKNTRTSGTSTSGNLASKANMVKDFNDKNKK
ncbi:YidC/Oxa1 family membrane protein insertase [Parasporobacterium paucivorans]|uniref:YidC/Oxa1 family membrane protein insertase n=1 Tax=Parasporobacterium paucivorans DSM 15970 TaxID=1122934 RepID=A0A1M6B9P8_9FIRM|nr:YidC/Oxa1 family membrane protein insertase [Parasporobacterium paucivorans]SHI45435.1 YidC/Oxa1 family membrane protein insertase [Parasporobacterium paucivorans DSM 15970]